MNLWYTFSGTLDFSSFAHMVASDLSTCVGVCQSAIVFAYRGYMKNSIEFNIEFNIYHKSKRVHTILDINLICSDYSITGYGLVLTILYNMVSKYA